VGIWNFKVVVQLLATLLACHLELKAGSGPSPDARVTPLWTADLGEYSYGSRPNPRYIGGKAYVAGKRTDIGVIFGSRDEVICYFVTSNAGHLQKRDSGAASDPFQLQIVSFLAKTGAVKHRKTLPAHFGYSSVFANKEGNLIVLTGNLLRLYAADFSRVSAERTLPSSEKYDEWTLRMSPSGTTLLLDHYSPAGSEAEILNAQSLSTLVSVRGTLLYPTFAISDKSVIRPDSESKNILIRTFDGPWSSVPAALSCVSNPVFLDDERLLNACGHEVVALKVNGDILLRDPIGKKEHLEQLASSTPDGRLAAVSAMQTKGGFADFGSVRRSRTTVLIYDVESGRRIVSVPVVPIPTQDYDFALAPDGSSIAIMTDSSVKLYAIHE
jgi:hypothetical protein